MMKKIAVYPGTFDPITNGHLSLVQRASGLFEELVVAVANNVEKKAMFSIDQRLDLVRQSLQDMDNVKIVKFDGLLVDLAKKHDACAIIRGLRAVSDFDYEFQMALMNRKLAREIETVFLLPALSWVYLSSTIVKDVAINHGDISGLVPPPVAEALYKQVNK
jgi:pantetheine-phosphate adenylyltransferase